MSKEFKILTIDGGGMKGIYSAKILEQLEKLIDLKSGFSIVDYFDMVCGTSTGGIIALAIAQRIPANNIVEFYTKYGRTIFPPLGKHEILNKIKRGRRQSLRGWIYDREPLYQSLVSVFDNKKIGDSDCLLCIPSYCLTKGQPWIFKYDHKEGNLSRDNVRSCVEVALATTAAPMYFPKYTLKSYHSYQYIDGGVYANNPTFVAFTEALDYFVGTQKEFQTLSILSIDSLNDSAAEMPELPDNQSILQWSGQLSRSTMRGQSYMIDYAMKKICSALNYTYCRIPSDEIGKPQDPLIQLDASSDKSIKLMMGKGEDQGNLFMKREEIKHFFSATKHYNIKERYSNG